MKRATRPQSDKLLAELEEKLHQGPGTVELNPDIEYPDYFEGMDFHLMPGNYNHGDLTGYIYDWAVKVFYFGVNDTDKTQRLLIEKAIQLPKRKIERALDLGCGIGQDATPIKVFCPDAEVIGLDLGGPMLKYAHKRAIDQGVDVTFTQRAAEDTGYPNQHFDFIFAFQLFHELPVRAMKDVLEEAHRILRPGGAMVIADIPRTVNVTPYRRWLRQWQVRNINEPFMGTYVDEDIPALIKNAGFQKRARRTGLRACARRSLPSLFPNRRTLGATFSRIASKAGLIGRSGLPYIVKSPYAETSEVTTSC